MVSGNTNMMEYDLVLPKILCGIDLEESIDTKKITKKQITEVREMLVSLVEHWSVLKNTSVKGLQESFLQRSGKLSMASDEWELLVEQKSYDMLLQSLPWNISMIKLPWMKKLLKTTWV
jgi:hypothetical protein